MGARQLGNQGLVVSELGLSCMGMSEFYGENNEQESIDTIHRAIDLGVTMFDTADMYGPFTNQGLVGRVIKNYRDKVVVATKFGNVRTEDGGFLGVNGTPEYVRQACDASLQRLGVLALAWLLAQDDDIVPIPGTRRRKYLEENIAATNITLTPEELQQIEAVAPKGFVSGDRYRAEQMKALNL
ncbi:MAG: aldo/keto reductase [Rivularia sp. (in: cyanobacteria)]